MIIDCDTCTVRGPACADCVVTVLLGAPAVWDAEEQRALGVLADSGLVPPLRLVSGGGPAGPPAGEAESPVAPAASPASAVRAAGRGDSAAASALPTTAPGDASTASARVV